VKFYLKGRFIMTKTQSVCKTRRVLTDCEGTALSRARDWLSAECKSEIKHHGNTYNGAADRCVEGMLLLQLY
jgi:hypothetical protein